MSELKRKYNEEIKNELKEKFGYRNINMVPKLEKVVINCVTRDAVNNAKVVEGIQEELGAIAGQKAYIARAKKSVASFKVREGQPLGAAVTLRGKRMYDFLYRLFNISLPRVKDFRGLSPKAFDGHGNYNLGIKEQIIFPEINYDKIDKVKGLNITVVTTASNNEEGRELLSKMGMPFKK